MNPKYNLTFFWCVFTFFYYKNISLFIVVYNMSALKNAYTKFCTFFSMSH